MNRPGSRCPSKQDLARRTIMNVDDQHHLMEAKPFLKTSTNQGYKFLLRSGFGRVLQQRQLQQQQKRRPDHYISCQEGTTLIEMMLSTQPGRTVRSRLPKGLRLLASALVFSLPLRTYRHPSKPLPLREGYFLSTNRKEDYPHQADVYPQPGIMAQLQYQIRRQQSFKGWKCIL